MSKKFILTLILGCCLSSLNSAWASPPTAETIEKYFQTIHQREISQQLYEIRKAYYQNLAYKRVLYQVQAPDLDPRLLTPKQQLVAEQIAALYLQDSNFRSPEYIYQHAFEKAQRYYSEESLKHQIEIFQTEQGQQLVEKNNLMGTALALHLPYVLERYLAEKDFIITLFRDVFPPINREQAQ
ncbi:hypothetical protein [Acinetobacter sp. 3657]|uniref:hypothetical protein n=1 Tax=Acinetobacter sp. 3657 TaxID=2817764 RepID=UPI00285DB131|nr:hypothetical protein [Prolinoborus sp. 3657]